MDCFGASFSHGTGRVWSGSSVDLVAKKEKKKKGSQNSCEL
jgi:hypothetical protein